MASRRYDSKSILYRVFDFLTPIKRKRLLVSFIIWFVKNILKGAGLLLVGGMIAGALHGDKKPPQPAQTAPVIQPAQTTTTIPIAMQRSVSPAGLDPSGRGEKYFKNDDGNVWIVPLYGNVKNTLTLWATDVYPQLKGREQEINSLPSFNRVANILEENIDPKAPNYLIMPPGFNRRIDVVNLFAGDIKPKQEEKTTDEQNI